MPTPLRILCARQIPETPRYKKFPLEFAKSKYAVIALKRFSHILPNSRRFVSQTAGMLGIFLSCCFVCFLFLCGLLQEGFCWLGERKFFSDSFVLYGFFALLCPRSKHPALCFGPVHPRLSFPFFLCKLSYCAHLCRACHVWSLKHFWIFAKPQRHAQFVKFKQPVLKAFVQKQQTHNTPKKLLDLRLGMPRKKKQHTKGLGDFLLCRYGAVLFYIKMQRSKVQIFMNAENGREEAKRKFLVGDSVIVLENTKKEKGLIIERKEKVRGNTKLGFICRLKLLSGQTKWVPETSLSRETAEVMCEFIEPYGVLPKIHLAPSLWIALGEDQKNVQISKNREEKCAEDTSNGHKEQRVSERHVLQRTSAEKVLLLFYQSQIELKPQAVEEVKEAVQGLKDLFVLAVHKTILYKEEREAYVASKLRPEQILETYTGMHVLRMLASLDSLGGLIGVNAEIAEHITEYAKLLAGFLEDMLTKEGK